MSTKPGPFAQRIAAELRAELARQERSRRWLGEQIGVPHATVARWIGGDTDPPLDALDAMCRALGLSVADILHAVDRNGGYEPTPLPAPRPPRTRRSVAATAPVADVDNAKGTRRVNAEYSDGLVAA